MALAVACIGIPTDRAASDTGTLVTAADCVVLALIAVVGVMVLARRLTVPRRTLLIFGPMVAALGITTICSTDIATSLPGFLRTLEIFVLVPLAVVLALRDRRDAMIICSAVLGLGLVEACYGIWQATTMNGAGIGGQDVRAVGTFGATEIMAMATVVGIGLIIAAAFALTRHMNRSSTRFMARSARGSAGRGRMVLLAVVSGLAIQVMGLLVSQSRGVLITVGVAVTVMLLSFDRRVAGKTLACCAALVIVVGGALGGADHSLLARSESITQSVSAPDRSVDDRYQLWSTAERIWNDHPITGVGIKNFPTYRDSYSSISLSSGSDTNDRTNGFAKQPLLSPHNEYLLILSEQGVVGLAGFAFLIGAIVRGLWKHRRPRDPFWLVGVGFMTFLFVEFIYGDLGGSTSVLTAVMLGVAASQALGRTPAVPAHSYLPDGLVSGSVSRFVSGSVSRSVSGSASGSASAPVVDRNGQERR